MVLGSVLEDGLQQQRVFADALDRVHEVSEDRQVAALGLLARFFHERRESLKRMRLLAREKRLQMPLQSPYTCTCSSFSVPAAPMLQLHLC